MIRKFFKDKGGNYALLTAITMVPLMGALALGVDYTDLVRQKTDTLNALDAAGLATARRIAEGATDAEAIAYAKTFFLANLSHADGKKATLHVALPTSTTGGGMLKLSASMKFDPYFLPVASWLIGKVSNSTEIAFNATSEIRLKNTLEVALVLDNSGSMNDPGSGSGQKRIDLLKTAAKQLVDTLAQQAALIKQVNKPVQFGVVPFAASVNIGANNANEPWMDTDGISPIHHENFDWDSFPGKDNGENRKVTKINGIYYKKGSDWGTQENEKVTRFTLYNEMKYYTNSNESKKANYTSWQGCVEQRPSPYDVNDAPADKSNPATLFVPMFAPDGVEGGYENWVTYKTKRTTYYWNDISNNKSATVRQAYMPKYFDIPTIGNVGPYGTVPAGLDTGPNASCTTKPITPLMDVSETVGMNTVKAAIDAMAPLGGTNVPSGLAWGWRVVSSGAPFSGGRPEGEKGNDKVVIVLTDGANTYYTPSSLGYRDDADNKSIYSDYGYLKPLNNFYNYGRLFLGTSNAKKTSYNNDNYTVAMNEQMKTLCNNAKNAGVLVMTVSLDLSTKKPAENAQIEGLKECASESRVRRDPLDPKKPAKLYWNSTGASLVNDFKEIGNELSNLRIVG